MVGKATDMTMSTDVDNRNAVIVVAISISFIVMCVGVLAIVPIGKKQHTIWGLFVALVVLIALGILASRPHIKEGFGPTVYQCSSGDPSSCPIDKPLEEIDASVIAKLPLKPCNLYLTDHIQECDDGMYQMHVLELKERRATMEAENATFHSDEIARINRVLEDAARLKRRQCKFTMNDWVRPDHSSFPLLKVMRSDSDNRGHPRQWAYCYAPLAATGAKEVFLASLEKNERANGETLARTGFNYKLSNELDNERVEFNTMDAEPLRRTFCTIFNPALVPGLQPFYSILKMQPRFMALDLTPDGIIINFEVYDWDDGFLRRIDPSAMIEVESGQDNNAEILKMDPKMPQEPARFNIETSYYCKTNNIRTMKRVYTEAAKTLFAEVVEGRSLIFQLKYTANVYVFNVNVCDRVDKVETMSGDLEKILGNSQVRNTPISGFGFWSRTELIRLKNTYRSHMCDLAIEMTKTYKDIQDVLAEQRKQGEEYRLYSQPDSGQRVVMTPQTIAKQDIFKDLRKRQLDLESKFVLETKRKKLYVEIINLVNMMIADLERKMEAIADNMLTRVKGKKLAILEKPYKYITNDGRLYFKM
jgi:hypothetical protein